MFSDRLHFFARRVWRSIWFRPAAYAVLAVLVLALTPLLQPLIPESLTFKIETDLVDRVLEMLTTAMLPVAIFSLTTMVTQLNAASQLATPRTRVLLAEDRTAQNAISTFIGAFLFGVLGVIGVHVGLYNRTGLVLLFALSLLLIGLVVLNLILWIRRLSSIGGVGGAIERVEHAAASAFRNLARDPWMGGRRAERLPEGAHPVCSGHIGFVESIDAKALGELSDRLGVTVHVAARPGDFVSPTVPLVLVATRPDGETEAELRRAFVIGNDREFVSDPRYGVIVLSEIASRALSPALNDPGSAIDVIGALVRVLAVWQSEVDRAAPEVLHPHLEIPDLDPAAVLTEGFRGIARDGARFVEVGARLQHGLGALARLHPAAFVAPARRLAEDQLARARAAIDFAPDLEALSDAARREWDRAAGEPTRLASG